MQINSSILTFVLLEKKEAYVHGALDFHARLNLTTMQVPIEILKLAKSLVYHFQVLLTRSGKTLVSLHCSLKYCVYWT